MSVLRRLTLLTLPFFVTACGAEESQAKTETPAQQVAPAAKQNFDEAALKAKFSKLGVSILDIQPSDVAGLLEIQTNGGVLFASNDGNHFIAGTLYAIDDNGGYKDVIAERQAPLNAEKIAKFSDSVIEYKADNEKYVVTVFTDITCGYCVRLHSQMQGYNDLGITVRYMAYPRQGATVLSLSKWQPFGVLKILKQQCTTQKLIVHLVTQRKILSNVKKRLKRITI